MKSFRELIRLPNYKGLNMDVTFSLNFTLSVAALPPPLNFPPLEGGRQTCCRAPMTADSHVQLDIHQTKALCQNHEYNLNTIMGL